MGCQSTGIKVYSTKKGNEHEKREEYRTSEWKRLVKCRDFHGSLLRIEPACCSRTWINPGNQFSMLVPFVSSFILGIPMMLYFMKIKKFGMVLITYIVYGVLLALAGVGIYTLVLGIIFALIAELLLRLGKYQKPNLAILAFAIASIGANGNVLSMVLASTEYLEGKAATYGSEYMQLMQSYFSEWWVLPLLALSAFLGGLLGGLLGKSVFKKHFIRSGVL